jgi:hypothetical protein
MLAAVIGIGALVSVALIAHLHGNAVHVNALGAWARPLELGAIVSVALMIDLLVRCVRRQPMVSRPWPAAGYLLVLAYLSSLTHPYEQGASYYTLILALGAFSFICAHGPAIVSRVGAGRVRVLEVVLFNVCVALVGSELVLRFTARVMRSPLLQRSASDAADWLEHNRGVPGQLRFGFPYNSRGEYDEEPVRRAAAGCLATVIGDSFNWGTTHHAFHFTSVAERALPGCTLSAIGVPQIGPEEYLLLLQREAVPLDPQVIVVDLFIGNDLIENLRGRDVFRGTMRRELDRDNLLVYTAPKRIVTLLAERRRRGTSVGALAGEHHDQPMTADQALLAFPWMRDPMLEPPSYSPEAFAAIETKHAREICVPNDEERYSYDRLFTLLGQMRAAAGRVPMVVMLIPDELQVEDAVWDSIKGALPNDAERDRPQRILRERLAAAGVRYLDLLPILRAVPPLADGRRHLYLKRDTHFNARGNQATGVALAEWISPYLRGAP